MALKAVNGVLPLPARTTKVLETFEVPTEVRPHHPATHSAEGVLQIGINLNLYQEKRDNR